VIGSRLLRLALALGVASSLTLAACAPKRIVLPTDTGSPLSDLADVHEQVSRGCRSVQTFTAELALAGHAGQTRLRGRVLAGFERPASMRLEGVAPFGPPAFILTAHGEATLLLPRDEAVLTGASPADVLGALTGVSLAPADLHAILTGCVVPDPRPTGGRLHGNGWASIDLEGDATIYVARVDGQWQARAATRRGWRVEYGAWQGEFPRMVTLQSMASGIDVSLSAAVSQVEANVRIDPAAFTVAIPPNARHLTLAELRDAGPLRDVAPPRGEK
jgi:outer membrane biogenesis lipoprotein LolB